MIAERSSNGTEFCTETCKWPEYKGNHNCEDENNNCGCDWDGGDCCGFDVPGYKEYNCLDPNFVEPDWDSCGDPWWWNDGECESYNNNAGCQWDGGDCDPDEKGPYQPNSRKLGKKSRSMIAERSSNRNEPCTGTCMYPEWKGDGYCHIENNNCGCDWDGGDCCGSDSWWTYECEDTECCLDPNYKEPEHTCGSPSYVHDYSCDDENNNSGCNWDGGDCCGDQNKDSSWCTECACLDPNYQGHKR